MMGKWNTMSGRTTWISLLLCLFLLFSGVKGFCGVSGEDTDDWVSIPGGADFRGSPTYITEFGGYYRDNGGPLSELGSHCGIKADVHDLNLATLRHFAAVTGSHLLDYSRTGFFGLSHLEILDASGSNIPFDERRINFNYSGWQEQASAENIEASAWIAFLDTEVYVLEFSVINKWQEGISFSPVLVFNDVADRSKTWFDSADGMVKERFKVRIGLFPENNYFTVAPAFNVENFEKAREGKGYRVNGEKVRLDPEEKFESFVVFSYSPENENSAISAAISARDEIQHSGIKVFRQAGERWSRLTESLPIPHTDDPGYEDLYLMSVAALEMALYKPRDKMKHWGCVPSKGHYNWFWLWDSGFQSLGYAEKDPVIAEDVVLTIFESQRDDGYIAHMTNDRLKRVSPHSQSPVFGYTVQKILPLDADEDRRLEFERRMYEQGEAYLGWWQRVRDRDSDGLFEFLSQDEGGWDNSPRAMYVPPITFISYFGMLGELIASRTKPLDAVDLNAWMYLYYQAMSEWAEDLGNPLASREWKQKAEELSARMDEILWSEACGCWLDAYRRPWQKDHHQFKVLTPHIWFPAWAGSTRDEGKARRVIEHHLLNPEEFFGEHPIPTVAYNDPLYDPSIPGWTGDIWLPFSYFALETLYRYGYEDEAADLKKRTLEMMANQGGMHGIYENYDPRTGSYKDEESTGGYCTFQFGWSAAFTIGMILDRWQEKRFIFDDTTEFSGFVREATSFSTRKTFLEFQASRDLPHIRVSSVDGMPLLECKRVRIKLTDPYDYLEEDQFVIKLKGREFVLNLMEESILVICPE